MKGEKENLEVAMGKYREKYELQKESLKTYKENEEVLKASLKSEMKAKEEKEMKLKKGEEKLKKKERQLEEEQAAREKAEKEVIVVTLLFFLIASISGRRLDQAVSAAASFEQFSGESLGQEGEGNPGERCRDQGFEEIARNYFQPIKGQVGVIRVGSMRNRVCHYIFHSLPKSKVSTFTLNFTCLYLRRFG